MLETLIFMHKHMHTNKSCVHYATVFNNFIMKLISLVMKLSAFCVVSTNTTWLKGAERCYSCRYPGTREDCLDNQSNDLEVQETM